MLRYRQELEKRDEDLEAERIEIDSISASGKNESLINWANANTLGHIKYQDNTANPEKTSAR